ncbi:hypothetical protein OS493_034875 [Desmophyllum pertusum]|uniref:TRADD-like N-terminal domain-containing protein n=1 Tax=Desmophyllum pertusum TaxID=174260 RepID=A0A9W9ZXR4_9CNID|nr:hypothetical protein OS493_034875 [Desmophyllum pertusum]
MYAILHIQIYCEAISGPGPGGGSSDPVLALQERKTGLPEAALVPTTSQAEATGGFGKASIKNSTSPTSQEVLNLAAFKYLQTKPEDFNAFVYYLEKVRKVLIVDTNSGSLIITVECSSLEILDGLWDDYCAGFLNEMVQKFLVTEDVLKELGLIEVKLTTTIPEEEYRACREYFLQYPDHSPPYVTSTTSARFGSELTTRQGPHDVTPKGGPNEVPPEEGLYGVIPGEGPRELTPEEVPNEVPPEEGLYEVKPGKGLHEFTPQTGGLDRDNAQLEDQQRMPLAVIFAGKQSEEDRTLKDPTVCPSSSQQLGFRVMGSSS